MNESSRKNGRQNLSDSRSPHPTVSAISHGTETTPNKIGCIAVQRMTSQYRRISRLEGWCHSIQLLFVSPAEVFELYFVFAKAVTLGVRATTAQAVCIITTPQPLNHYPLYGKEIRN